ncbi:hypothetical protein DU508_21785 [Pedobacter chinensis]|uniref:Multi-ubiquitin domain-containing protein n=2 Tax=Pedobacter chinensis TaxID=2282421 RepID=A0A369PUN7_9SPHI|nr:hypothetical protein DU508_21785 [Pedobacter chinensis]
MAKKNETIALIGGSTNKLPLLFMKPNSFEIRVNDRTFNYEKSTITGKELLILIGLNHSTDYEILFKLVGKEFEPIQLDEVVDLADPRIETFFIKPYPSVVIEVDDEIYPIAHIFMTPTEILTLAGIDADKHYLKQILEAREITYKNDKAHVIAMHHKMKFVSCKIGNTTVS